MRNFDIKLNINCKLYISLVAESRSPPPDACPLLPLIKGDARTLFRHPYKGGCEVDRELDISESMKGI